MMNKILDFQNRSFLHSRTQNLVPIQGQKLRTVDLEGQTYINEMVAF